MINPEKGRAFAQIAQSFEQDNDLWNNPDQLRQKINEIQTGSDIGIFNVIALIYRFNELVEDQEIDLETLKNANTAAELAMLLCMLAKNNPYQLVRLVHKQDEAITYAWCAPYIMQLEVADKTDPVINFRTNLFKLFSAISSQGLTIGEVIPLLEVQNVRDVATRHFRSQGIWMIEDFPGFFREEK